MQLGSRPKASTLRRRLFFWSVQPNLVVPAAGFGESGDLCKYPSEHLLRREPARAVLSEHCRSATARSGLARLVGERRLGGERGAREQDPIRRSKDDSVMMPSFGKSEVENSIDEAIHASAERQKAENKETATEIITAINSFADSYNSQRIRDERKNKVKAFIDIATMLLLFGTALFTGSAWWVFREQLHQMERAYAPIKESAEATKASAEAAKASAEAARAAVELSTETAERQLPTASLRRYFRYRNQYHHSPRRQ
jgi:hypothetical protein